MIQRLESMFSFEKKNSSTLGCSDLLAFLIPVLGSSFQSAALEITRRRMGHRRLAANKVALRASGWARSEHPG